MNSSGILDLRADVGDQEVDSKKQEVEPEKQETESEKPEMNSENPFGGNPFGPEDVEGPPQAVPRMTFAVENGESNDFDEEDDESSKGENSEVSPPVQMMTIGDVEAEEPPQTSTVDLVKPDNLASTVTDTEVNGETDEGDGVYSFPPPGDRTKLDPPPGTLYTVQATHKYAGEDVDELSFESGEIIYVIQFENEDEQDDGWQMGIKASDGVKGVFPENFTQKM